MSLEQNKTEELVYEKKEKNLLQVEVHFLFSLWCVFWR